MGVPPPPPPPPPPGGGAGGLPPPLPPPSHSLPPPPPMPMPMPPRQPMPQQQVRAPLPTAVLLTDVPPLLHHPRAIRDWFAACGSGARGVQFVPKQPVVPAPAPVGPTAGAADGDNDGETAEGEKKKNGGDEPGAEETAAASSGSNSGSRSVTALVTLSHADAALRFVCAFKHFKAQLSGADGDGETANKEDEGEFGAFRAYRVPVNPDVPLPPAAMDPSTVTILGGKLLASFEAWRSGAKTVSNFSYYNSSQQRTTTTNAEGGKQLTASSSSNNAAGEDDGDDDDEEGDPLEAPHVLEAVREFRRKLERMQGSKAERRKELVARKIEQMLPLVRQRVQQEEEDRINNPQPPPPPPAALAGGNLPPPPPLPMGLPPPPLPAPGPADPRGVSNLPAWMTRQQQQQQQQQQQEEPPAKRAKIDDVGAGTPFPGVPESAREALRAHIAAQIRQVMGEEEATLIEFVLKHVLDSSKPARGLLPELKEVLGDDDDDGKEADAFFSALWDKVQELAAGSA